MSESTINEIRGALASVEIAKEELSKAKEELVFFEKRHREHDGGSDKQAARSEERLDSLRERVGDVENRISDLKKNIVSQVQNL